MEGGNATLYTTFFIFQFKINLKPTGMNNPNAYKATKGPAVINASEPLQTNLTDAAAACKQYRGYIASRYREGFADGYTSYLLNREDLDTLLQEQTLDGIRIYIGHEDKGNGPLVRLFAVGCQLALDGTYQDVIEETAAEPAAQITTKTTRMLAVEGLAPVARLTSGRPCPSECGGKSVLNS